MIYIPPIKQSDWSECYNHGIMIIIIILIIVPDPPQVNLIPVYSSDSQTLTRLNIQIRSQMVSVYL